MSTTDVEPLEASIEIQAPSAEVWHLVSDLRNMPRWSPQCRRTFLRGEAGVGATAININRRGLLVWPTQSTIVRYVEGNEIAFRVKENYTVWSYQLEDLGGDRTRLTSRRDAPQGISGISVGLTKVALGGLPQFTAELREGMQATLSAIKTDLEG